MSCVASRMNLGNTGIASLMFGVKKEGYIGGGVMELRSCLESRMN